MYMLCRFCRMLIIQNEHVHFVKSTFDKIDIRLWDNQFDFQNQRTLATDKEIDNN